MLIYLNKEKKKKVIFLRPIDLKLFTAKKIPFNDAPYLLYYDMASEDLISWLSYQRSMEKKWFGGKFTRLQLSDNARFAGVTPKYDMALLNLKLDTVYNEIKYYAESKFCSYIIANDVIVILNKNDTMLEPNFKAGQENPVKAIYHALLTDVGYYKFYFNEPLSDIGDDGIDLPQFLSVAVM